MSPLLLVSVLKCFTQHMEEIDGPYQREFLLGWIIAPLDHRGSICELHVWDLTKAWIWCKKGKRQSWVTKHHIWIERGKTVFFYCMQMSRSDMTANINTGISHQRGSVDFSTHPGGCHQLSFHKEPSSNTFNTSEAKQWDNICDDTWSGNTISSGHFACGEK